LTHPNSQFATTQWTVVWQAAEEDSNHGRPALTEIVRRYWQPLYSYARRRGYSSEDAEDATQEFLSHVMSGQLLESADPAKGKFRSFLLTAWKRFLVDEYRKQNASRRGGDAEIHSLNVGAGEQNWLELSSRDPDPDRTFHLSWANSLLDEARLRIRDEYSAKGKAALVDVLLPRLTHSMDSQAYAQLGAELKMSSGAIKVALHRLRQRFGSALREVVVETVEDSRDVDAELNEMLRVLSE
jgi:RNA polymerase sigma factor (sigma-70 family)